MNDSRIASGGSDRAIIVFRLVGADRLGTSDPYVNFSDLSAERECTSDAIQSLKLHHVSSHHGTQRSPGLISSLILV